MCTVHTLYLRTTNKKSRTYGSINNSKIKGRFIVSTYYWLYYNTTTIGTTLLAHLELCATILLVHLAKQIIARSNFNIQNKYFWSDTSTVPLSRWKTFVAHCVGEIHQYT